MSPGMRHVSAGTLRHSFDRRSMVIGGLQGGLGVLLAARLGYIAVAENEKYQLESESNRVNLSLIPPRRGWILDRNGVPLASNRADFRVDIIPDRMVDGAATISRLGELLQLTAVEIQDLRDKIKQSSGFAPVEVASGVDVDQYSAVSVRLPELPGVITQRGFSRYYPSGPSVAHLIGYVGPANAEEYKKDHNPLLITPGFKIGKDGIEKSFEKELRGVPGARRVEVTASGRIVRELETREDVQGQSIKLTVDGPLQDYAARRIGLESGSVAVIDCATGGILALTSMPAFDPNSFVGGIGRLRWKMLNEDDHIPLLNKSVRGLYPPGSTMKPMESLALQMQGVSPDEHVYCPGGYQLGRRFFRCDAVHGSVDMRTAIERSCNTYFWTMVHRVGYESFANVARMLGLGQEFDLPGTSQRYGTIPDPEWKMRRYHQEWTAADGLNASIGQGYVLVNPLQLAVMTARIATGKTLLPSLMYGNKRQLGPALPFTPEQLQVTHDGMFRVVNGSGTAGVARLKLDGIQMAGKTGTAQVRKLVARGHFGDWKSRDHSLFVCYAPADAPRYAIAVVIEHGTFGSRAAAPIARDVMTFLFDPAKGLETLHDLEKQWGGTAQQRLDAKYNAFVAAYGGNSPKVDGTAKKDKTDAEEKTGREKAQPTAEAPRKPPLENRSSPPPAQQTSKPATSARPASPPPAAPRPLVIDPIELPEITR